MYAPPLVSIITPMFNAARFLDETVRSVLAQTHTAWELLLIDDGSRDESLALAVRWAAADPARIRALAHPRGPNHGASATRNLGLRHARGGYVALLDADDVWLPGHLAGMLALLERHPRAAFAYGPTEDWYGWTDGDDDRRRDRIPALGVAAGHVLAPPGPLAAFVRRDAPSPCTCSVVARRAAIDAAGGFEAEFPGMYDDQALYAKLLLTGPVVVADACTSRYRRHADSCYSTARATGRAPAERARYLEWLDAYLSERHPGERALARAVRRERWALRHPRLAPIARAIRLRRFTREP
ncbi:MAG TPA: glycosyltransferase family A protein [Gemmatimonadales bacterium]|nr:glycosyltransferase family A protein [Gemmatimonadales bacterium]